MSRTKKLPQLMKLFAAAGLIALMTGCAGSRDKDKDGIPDKIDECPAAAEDMDSFQDNDGCPDKDNDKDKVPDSRDKCPFIPEDRDGFEDDDGCPDKDNDKDGMPDDRDKCPDQAEDRDNFKDTDGCPEIDNDEDGVPDAQDKCPLDPEDKDGFQDEDGCMELDNDGDGIKDKFDKCPNEKEVINGRDDDDGCPDADAEPVPEKTTLNLRFETGTPHLTYEDQVQLEQTLVTGLKAWPQHKIYVYIFMPMVEMEMETYLTLLNARTKTVADFLLAKGVGRAQIKTRTITAELLESVKGSDKDFNSDRPAMFIRK